MSKDSKLISVSNLIFKNKSLFNLNDLENPIHFIQKGKINKRTLHWTGNTIYLDPKTYDGTTKVYTHGGDRHE